MDPIPHRCLGDIQTELETWYQRKGGRSSLKIRICHISKQIVAEAVGLLETFS